DDWVIDPQLPEDQQGQSQHEQDHQRLHPPERVAYPVPFLPLAEHDLPAGHYQNEQSQADVVEVQRPATQFGPFLLQVIRVLDHDVGGEEGQQGHGDIDEEDPAPVVVDHQPAAQGRADDGRDQGRQTEYGLGLALLLGREGVQQDPLAGGLEAATG